MKLLNSDLYYHDIMRIPEYLPFLEDEEGRAARKTVDSGMISPSGEKVNTLEKKFSEILKVEHCVAVDSGTAALHTALESLDLNREGKVIVPCHTYGSTALAVKQAGMETVLVDVEEETLGLDPEKVEEKIDGDTEAIIVAHLMGRAADMEEINRIAEENNVKVIEDAAQALGREYNGEKLGTLGDVGCFSFAWNKNITTGKGGLVATNDREIAEESLKFSDYGINPGKRFEVEKTGYNYRMDNIRAAIGLKQLEKLEKILEEKRRISKMYRQELGDTDVAPAETDGSGAFYILSGERDRLQDKLEEKGIGSRKLFPPLNRMKPFKQDSDFPVSEKLSRKGLVLPNYPEMSNQDVKEVCDTVKEYL